TLPADLVRDAWFPGADALTAAFLGREAHFWLGPQLEPALMDHLRIGFTNRRFGHLGHGRFAVQPLEMGGRYLAGAKAAKLHAAFDIVEPSINLGFQIGGGDDDTKFAF